MADVRKLEGLLEDLHSKKRELESEIRSEENLIRKSKELISNMRDPDKGPVSINNSFMEMPDDPDPEIIKREKQLIRRITDINKKKQRVIDKLVREKDKVNKHIAGTMDAIRRAKSE